MFGDSRVKVIERYKYLNLFIFYADKYFFQVNDANHAAIRWHPLVGLATSRDKW